jgi:hypothetical protein
MALDNTAKLSNITDSLKKYFVDNLYTVESIHLDFGKSYEEVYKDLPERVDQWAIVAFDPLTPDTLSELSITIYMFSRRDPESKNLYLLRDKIFNYLIDTSQTDGLARVTIYDTSNPASWVAVGKGVVILPAGRSESANYMADDGTKFRYLSLLFKWGAKV